MKTALICTISAFLGNIITKSKHSVKLYIIFFLITLTIGLFLEANAYELYPYESKLTEDQKVYYMERYEFHKAKAISSYETAKNMSMFCLDLTDKEKADYCFKTLMATLVGSTPMSKVISAGIAFMSQFVCDSIGTWHTIQVLLYDSKHHYELQEFYADVLING